MQRRTFLQMLAIVAAAPNVACAQRPPRIGLALGGGGARGLAHVPVLELLDELGLKPDCIAGTSIGAVMGVLYAGGMSGKDIRRMLDKLTVNGDEDWLNALFDDDLDEWLGFFNSAVGEGGLLDTEPFMDFIVRQTGVERLEQLSIPTQVVATDYWGREQVVFDEGPIRKTLNASIAMPGVFKPVEYQGRLLVDGGLVNPVPFDLLHDCDMVIAVNVLGQRTPDGGQVPSSLDSTFHTFQVMQHSIVREKLARYRPDFYIEPKIENVRVLEFYKIDSIYRQSQPDIAKLKEQLRAWQAEHN